MLSRRNDPRRESGLQLWKVFSAVPSRSCRDRRERALKLPSPRFRGTFREFALPQITSGQSLAQFREKPHSDKEDLSGIGLITTGSRCSP